VVLLEWLEDDNEPVWETLQALGTELSRPALIVLADYEDNEWATDALNKGVRAILPQSASTDEIIATVVAVAVGLVVLPPDLVEDLLPQNGSPTSALPASPIQALTPREVEVLGMLALGLGNKTIASRLGYLSIPSSSMCHPSLPNSMLRRAPRQSPSVRGWV
jgi:DNA-binding NarL/FixJ family response regulator